VGAERRNEGPGGNEPESSVDGTIARNDAPRRGQNPQPQSDPNAPGRAEDRMVLRRDRMELTRRMALRRKRQGQYPQQAAVSPADRMASAGFRSGAAGWSRGPQYPPQQVSVTRPYYGVLHIARSIARMVSLHMLFRRGRSGGCADGFYNAGRIMKGLDSKILRQAQP